MKKLFVLFLAVIMSFSLIACGKEADNAVSDIEVNGKTVSVTEFLTENLGKYISSENFVQNQQYFMDITASEAAPFTVTRVIEVIADNLGPNSMSVHYLAVKADCQWANENGDLYSDTLLIVDYDTGIVYDQFMVDESYLEDEESKDYWTYVMLNGPLCGSDYDGGPLFTDRETRIELSDDEIAKINESLVK